MHDCDVCFILLLVQQTFTVGSLRQLARQIRHNYSIFYFKQFFYL